MAGRTMRIVHKGETIIVAEGQDNTVELRFTSHRQATDKKFPAACREALSWLLANAGGMRGTRDGSYERDTT